MTRLNSLSKMTSLSRLSREELKSLLLNLLEQIKPATKADKLTQTGFEAGKQQAIEDIISLLKSKDC